MADDNPLPLAEENPWTLCRFHAAPFIHGGGDETAPEVTTISADQGEASADDVYSLHGNVVVTRQQQQLTADHAVYDKTKDNLKAKGNISYQQQGMSFQGGSADVNIEPQTGTIESVEFQLHDIHGRGSAESAVLEGPDVTVLKRTSYTTCDPGDQDWMLRSTKVRLNQATGVGTAQNVVLSFMHVPFLYSPYLSFPINGERKSGFLTPSYRHSDSSGVEYQIPYYLNLAPNRDAVITPKPISKRGTQFLGEFRYLNRTNAGTLNLEMLHGDKLYNDEDRKALYFRHAGNPAPRMRTNIVWNYVSDNDYLKQLGDSISITSTTHLERRADLTYQGDGWLASATAQGYQTLDETIPNTKRPYQRLPQLLLTGETADGEHALDYKLYSELVNFEREDRVRGLRLDLHPGISKSITTMATFLTPAVGMRYTRYNLQDQVPGTENDPVRSVPIFTLDGGVFLERDLMLGSSAYLQTLEPRLYYLYAPFREQSDIPVFDSGVPDFTFSQLFRDNRFNGADRVGDANQLTVALTTRFLENDTGRERFRAAIGRIFYFRDRKVQLSGTTVETGKASDVVAEASAQLADSLTLAADVRWDADNRQVDKRSVQIRYRPGYRRIVNITYRFREASLKQTDVSLLWPLARHWHLVGKNNYSFVDEKDLESLYGIEYQSCCWTLQLVKHFYIRDVSQESDSAIMLQLELKGLSSIGRSINKLLEEAIPDYQP